ncbi:MAG: hypothetical protein GY732_24030 [Gammaproteobacteria bacterium]|nr:hypothetical protein [Gammaproteobacteria bacterium]
MAWFDTGDDISVIGTGADELCQGREQVEHLLNGICRGYSREIRVALDKGHHSWRNRCGCHNIDYPSGYRGRKTAGAAALDSCVQTKRRGIVVVAPACFLSCRRSGRGNGISDKLKVKFRRYQVIYYRLSQTD